MQLVKVPPRRARIPREATSARRSGAMVESPATRMPTLPKLANPHNTAGELKQADRGRQFEQHGRQHHLDEQAERHEAPGYELALFAAQPGQEIEVAVPAPPGAGMT